MHPSKRRRRAFVAAVAVLAGSVTFPGTAQGASEKCEAAYRPGSKVLSRDKGAVAFRRRSVVYGCLDREGVLRRLPRQRLMHPTKVTLVVEQVQVAGRYAGYVVSREEGQEIHVFDLRTGRPFVRSEAVVSGALPNAVRSFVVKRNGSVAWIAQGPAFSDASGRPFVGGELEVNRIVAGSTSVDTLSRGMDIEGGSLALSADARTLYWVQAGSPRSAPIG